MHIGLVAGSTRAGGTTVAFLAEVARRWSGRPGITDVSFAPDIEALPLFTSSRLAAGRPGDVGAWAAFAKTRDALLVATPEYAHGVPAALKSALEWLVASGEFSRKRVLACTVTPHAPRGEKCLRALTWTLQAMDAEVVAELPVYATAETLRAPSPGAEWLELVEAARMVLVG